MFNPKMKNLNWFHFLSIFLLLNIVHESISESQPIKKSMIRGRTKFQDASLYPGIRKTGLRLDFSELADFSNLPELAENEGFLGLGLFCVRKGAWLLYRQTDYNSDITDNIKLASGENKCFKPVGISSAQPIGPVSEPKKDSITFFHKQNFGGIARPTSKSVAASFFRSARTTVKSLALIGRQNWTITIGSGKKYCIRPRFGYKEESSPICLLPDFTKTKIGRAGVNIIQVLKGCGTPDGLGDTTLIDVSFCDFWGKVPMGKSKSMLDDPSKKLSGRSGNQNACSGGGEKAREMQETLGFYKAILTGSFDHMVILSIPELDKDKWMLELLDTIFDIAKVVTPPDLISDTYLNRVRELFIYKLALVWQSSGVGAIGAAAGNGTAAAGRPSGSGPKDVQLGLLTEYDYRGMLYQTAQCLSKVDDSLAASNLLAWNAITDPTPSVVESTIWQGLLRKKDANIVLEMTWLITNMAGGLCHKMFGYAHNYWALYIHLVNKMYLKPLVPEWNKKFPNVDIILGGDTNMMYNKLAMFTSMSLFASNSMEPFQRPTKESYDEKK